MENDAIRSLVEQQDKLHSEGQSVLDTLALLPELGKCGKPVIVGSFALELLTRRDIDIEVIVDSPNKKNVQGICAYLAGLDLPRIDFSLIDNTVDRVPQLPIGYYLGIRYMDKNIPFAERNPRNILAWQIDIHFLAEENSTARKKGEEIKSKLTPEKRISIMEIKQNIATNPKYHKEVFSVNIYDAVLDHDVNNLGKFKDYMKAKGVDL